MTQSDIPMDRPRVFDRLDHVGIVVRDADQALKYYATELRMPVIHDERLEHIGVRLVYLDMTNAFLQLVEPIGDGAVRDHFEQYGEGLHHICLSVPDIPQVLTMLAGEASSVVFQGGRGRLACFLQAKPNGVLLELTENTARATAPTDWDSRMSHVDGTAGA